MTTENTITYFEITNNWDDRTFCALDNSWVNDGRESTMFKTETEAQAVIDMHLKDDADRVAINFVEFELED